MSGTHSILTQERLRELLTLDSKAGHFTWAKRMKGGSGFGNKAGMLRGDGYWIIRLDRVLYLAHRLVWMGVHGAFPNGDIDHINGIRSDNRIENLRCVSRSVNLQNQRKARSNNITSGILGVCEVKTAFNKRWKASLQIDGKTAYQKYFYSKIEAEMAYLKVKRELHEGCTI